MKLEIKLEEPSSIQRRLIVSVPPEAFEATYQTHLKDVQKKAKLKGFRQGHVPLPMVQKMYGADLNQRVLQDLVDQSYSQALKEKGLRPVSRPTIEASEKDGRLLKENKELNYVATFEVLPEITLKKYKNLSLEKQKLDIKEKDIDEVLKQLQDSRAQMEPISEDTQASRKVKKGDYVDLDFDGGLVTENGVEPYPGMKGSRPLEIGSNSLIPGFEDEVVGLRWGEEKTFKITFPKEYGEEKLQEKEAEFKVKVNAIKEKKVPEITDELAKELQYENVKDMREKIKEALTKRREQEIKTQLQEDLLTELVKENPFEVPPSISHAQYHRLSEEWVQSLKQQRFPEQMIQEALKREKESLEKRAEKQVRSGFILEAIAKEEGLAVDSDDYKKEVKRLSDEMKMKENDIEDYYSKNPKEKENLEFRIKEEKTIDYILSVSKIKEK